jgi:hypothetical protein
MKLDELPAYCRELLALHSILMSAGIDVSDLFVTQLEAGTAVAIMIGPGKNCCLQATSTPTGKTTEEFMQQWREATKAWNENPAQERIELVDSSEIRQHAVQIMAILSLEGLLTEESVDIMCPFCSGTVRVHQDNSPIAHISHSRPFCEKFTFLETPKQNLN